MHGFREIESLVRIDKFIKYKDKFPKLKNTVFVAKGVVIIGDVEIDDNSNIWFNSVIRAE